MRIPSFILCLALLSSTGLPAAPASFLTPESSHRLGESLMIPLSLDIPATETFTGRIVPQPAGSIEILRQPEFLAGQSIGFARIRTLKPGKATLDSGSSKMRLNVSSERPLSMVRLMRPRITSPSDNSHVWGTISIGAEMWVGAPGVDRNQSPDATLHLPDGRTVQAAEAFPPVDGPFWRLLFHLDTSSLPPGDHLLAVSATPPVDGTKKHGSLTSEPHTLRVLPPPGKSDEIFSGECELTIDTPRTERMGMEPPGITFVRDASGHRAVALRRNRPAWIIRPEIKQPGRYQLMARARGSLAGSAYPSLGIVLGEEATDSGSVRLASADWHNVPVGRPVTLQTGTHAIGITLANEFNYRNQIMREAEIDRYELRRIPDNRTADTGMMMADSMMMEDKKPDGKKPQTRADQLRVAFTTLADGDGIRGRTQIHATLNSPSLRNERDYALIRSQLIVNGQPAASATGQNPVFTLVPHDFSKGTNTLQIISTSPCGNQATSLTQKLVAGSSGHPHKPLETTYESEPCDLNHGSWKNTQRVPIKPDSPLSGTNAPSQAHTLAQGKPIRFDVPSHIQGPRRISLLARQLPGQEPATLSIRLHQPEHPDRTRREIKLPDLTAPADWSWQHLPDTLVAEGRKWLTIELASGQAAVSSLGFDTKVFVDASPPSLTVLYPKPKATLSAGGDAIVVQAFDDLALSHFEVFLDGKPFPLPYPAGTGTGPMLLALPASLLEPGSHRIEVAATDESGKTTRTPAIPVQIRRESGPSLTLPYPRAVRLAKNLGLGPDPRTLIRLLTQGEPAWLEEQLAGSLPDEPLVQALADTLFPSISDYNIRGRVITHLLATRYPVRARFAQFSQNHFSTWLSKTGTTAKWREHQSFLDVGPARFQDLLLTSATSPAMMVYLDQQNSFGKQLNENYARELMELHTVGVHAGYQQSDVTHLARLLSGWGAQREATMDGSTIGYEYRYSPYLADPQKLEVFGLSIPALGTPDTADDRVRLVIEMLACRPQTARFFSEKLASHYLGPPVRPDLIASLEREFLASGGDLRHLLMHIALSPDMMATSRAEKIMPPVEFAVATQRTASSIHPWSAINLADRSGRNLFDRASPDGYPEDNDEYSDSNYQLQKWRFCKELEWQLRGHFPHSAFHKDARSDESRRNALIDLAYAARAGTPPSPSSRTALHQILSQPITDENQARNLFTSVLHMMPEFQSR